MNIMNIMYTFNSGGVERLAIDVSNQLIKDGHNAFLCIISENYSNDLLDQIDSKVNINLLKRENKNRKIGYIKQLLNIIDYNNIEVMHVHQGLLMSFYLIIKVLRPNLRIYFTVHDTSIFSELSLKNRIISVMICNKIIAISDAVSNDIIRNYVSKNKVVRIYNGVNFNRFSLMDSKIKQDGVITIVNVARFFPKKKGQDILIKAASILKKNGYRIKVVFAGGEISEDPTAIDDMKKLAIDMKVSNEIDFLGNISDVPSILKSADIFCIPSRYEGFGISAVEAMAMGIPCVASDIIGLDEVVNDKCLGELFTMNDEHDLANKLAYVIDNKSKFIASTISKNVNNRFSIQRMTEELLCTYQS